MREKFGKNTEKKVRESDPHTAMKSLATWCAS